MNKTVHLIDDSKNLPVLKFFYCMKYKFMFKLLNSIYIRFCIYFIFQCIAKTAENVSREFRDSSINESTALNFTYYSSKYSKVSDF